MGLIPTFNTFISAPLLASGENHTDSATDFFFGNQVMSDQHCSLQREARLGERRMAIMKTLLKCQRDMCVSLSPES